MNTTLLTALALAVSGGVTPYDVTAEGLTLPEGRVFSFQDVQDANFRLTSGLTVNLHFEESKSHALAGSGFVSWQALGFQPGDCIEWVQLHGFNEHFGEGGQQPVCIPESAPEQPAEPEPADGESTDSTCGEVSDFGPHGPCPDLHPVCPEPTHCVVGWTEPAEPAVPTEPVVEVSPAPQLENVELPQVRIPRLAQTGSPIAKGAAVGAFLVAFGTFLATRKRGSL